MTTPLETGAREAADPGATVSESEDGRPGATLGATTDQSLWRAATVGSEYGETSHAITVEGDAEPVSAADLARRYRVHEVLGVGGMGEVRLCVDDAIGREVAMKTLIEGRGAAPRATHRFFREVRVQGQLEHPSVVPVYDIGVSADGRLFFTMRRVCGPTLAEVLAALARGDAPPEPRGDAPVAAEAPGSPGTAGRTPAPPAGAPARISQRKLLEAFVRVCLVVDYAHGRGVIHRDLKPANIMLGSYGEVYVLDWGVAKLSAEAPAAEAPATEADAAAPPVTAPPPPAPREGRRGAVGTPGYMAPEQVLGMDAAQGPRADVYALGAVLYEILTLRPLHRGKRDQVLDATLAGADARASAVAPDVPPELDDVCVRATQVDRGARFASAREMAEAVERYLEGHRDVERRRALAADPVARARDAARRSQGLSDVASAEAARAEAMREVIQALALDAELPDARRLLVQLLLEVPERLPPSVEVEIAEAERRGRVQTARSGVYALLGWVATIPFAASLGVRDVVSFGATSALTVAAALYAAWLWRTGRATPRYTQWLAVLLAAVTSALSCWLGPFVLTPVAVTSTMAWFTFQSGPRERRLLMLLGGLATLAPFVLEALGWVPRSFTFEAGRLVLHPRAVFLPERGTTLALAYTSVTFCVLQPVLLGRVRDALSEAERKLFLHAWHLRQLAPDAGKGP
jgi:serine/threonine protein kinase